MQTNIYVYIMALANKFCTSLEPKNKAGDVQKVNESHTAIFQMSTELHIHTTNN